MLETDWLKVGTAGKTIDGREITPEMLDRAGATYSLAIYTASLNSEHFFFPGLGTVTACKAADDEQGRRALYVKLNPSAEFIGRNHTKRQLFFSMELRPGFPEEGDWYLTGLAITDEPASQGLQPLHFRVADGERTRFYSTAALTKRKDGLWRSSDVPTPAAPPAPTGEEEMPGWASRLLASIRSLASGGAGKDTPKDEEAMTPQDRKEFDDLKKTVGELSTAVTGLVEKLGAGKGADQPAGDGKSAADPSSEQHGKHPADEQKHRADSDGESVDPTKKLTVREYLDAELAEWLKPINEKLDRILNEPVETEKLAVNGEGEGDGKTQWV